MYDLELCSKMGRMQSVRSLESGKATLPVASPPLLVALRHKLLKAGLGNNHQDAP
jgi:hypothetical protein